MAQAKLGTYEAEEGVLPPVCLRCGAPATGFWGRRFTWQPGWIYVLLAVNPAPYLVGSLLLRRRLRVLAPFCDAHRRTGWARLLLAAGVIILLALLLRGVAEWTPNFFLLLWLAGLFWLALIFLLRLKTLRAIEITEDSITLTGVAEAFALALQREKATALPSRYQPQRPLVQGRGTRGQGPGQDQSSSLAPGPSSLAPPG
jgi:hypothetical protein